MVLVTDESRSFTFFLYNDLQWASQSAGGPYAQAGFNAGDGITATMLKYSRTQNIILLVNESNVNAPGLFAFRIDTANIEAGGCNENGSLTHYPVRGDQIGGATITLRGPCFDTNKTVILCRFGEFGTVYGWIQSEFRAVCISPLAAYPNVVNLSVSFDNEEVILRKNHSADQVVFWNDTIELEWAFSSTLLTENSSDALIDIDYEIFQPDEESTRRRARASNQDVDIKIGTVYTLVTDIRPQVGRQTIQINLSDTALQQQRILPIGAVIVGAFRIGIYIYRGYKIYRSVKTLVKIIQKASGVACDLWSDNEPDPSTWNQNLLPCPNTARQAQVARAQYEPDALCRDGRSVPTWISLVGNCWYHQGRPEFNEDNAAACYRSIRSNENGAGGQCCYNEGGQLITRGTGAGSDDRYHSGQTFWKHQFHDVITFLACCKFQSDPTKCDKYLERRPSRPGSNTMGQFGGAWGDPHFLTLDGTSYTFNGYGEYIYLVIPSKASIAFDINSPLQFESQIRSTTLSANMTDVTAIKAFAARVDSMSISITVSRRNQLLVYLNNEELTFEIDSDTETQFDTITLRFDGFSITKNLTNNQFTLSWSLGVSIQVTPVIVNTASTLVLNVAAAVGGNFKGNWTLGLIGSYDGNPMNDLRDKNGTVVGTVNMLTPQQIHELYGMSWAIDPTRSLFYYETNDNASFYAYQNQRYRPRFVEPVAGSLESDAREACNIPMNATSSSEWTPIQRTCYYDIAVTQDIDFGLVSRQAAEQQTEQREAIRNPPQFNSQLSLTRIVFIDQLVEISFQAISEFSSSIIYKLLHGPDEATLDEATGQFQWTVPRGTVVSSRIPVKVSAQDTTYNFTSAYELVLKIQQKSIASIFTISTLLLILLFITEIMIL
ncbi:unnamed protein product [Rotaria sp. Silwood1]|nr:unnamed protein product [Rotaria sp. Silwood1]CAF1679862.1 unnamed protein product [Rotaria sp. Silwood1]